MNCCSAICPAADWEALLELSSRSEREEKSPPDGTKQSRRSDLFQAYITITGTQQQSEAPTAFLPWKDFVADQFIENWMNTMHFVI